MFFAWFENWREQPVFVKMVVKWMIVKVREKCDVKAYIIVFSYLFQKSSTHFSHLAVLRMAEKNVVRVRSKPKLCFHLIFKRTLLIFEWKLWVLSKVLSVWLWGQNLNCVFIWFPKVFTCFPKSHFSHLSENCECPCEVKAAPSPSIADASMQHAWGATDRMRSSFQVFKIGFQNWTHLRNIFPILKRCRSKCCIRYSLQKASIFENWGWEGGASPALPASDCLQLLLWPEHSTQLWTLDQRNTVHSSHRSPITLKFGVSLYFSRPPRGPTTPCPEGSGSVIETTWNKETLRRHERGIKDIQEVLGCRCR